MLIWNWLQKYEWLQLRVECKQVIKYLNHRYQVMVMNNELE